MNKFEKKSEQYSLYKIYVCIGMVENLSSLLNCNSTLWPIIKAVYTMK